MYQKGFTLFNLVVGGLQVVALFFEPVFTATSAPNRSTRSRMKHEDFGQDHRCRSATLVAATYLNFSSKTKLTYNAITTQYSLWLVLIYQLGRVDAQSVS